jgi:Na+/proline symporter
VSLAFTIYDWGILFAYVALLAFAGYQATRRNKTTDDYFLAGHHAPVWLVAVSVLSTMQSAATFLGAPDNSYRGDYSYLTSNFAAIIAAFLVARFLIPRFYAIGATTVYELLETRFDATARRAAAGMYLVGRILASGARLYLAAIAVSMIIFLDVQPQQIIIASAVLVVFGVAFTLFGGLNAVIWSDLVQVVLYLGGAVLVLVFLLVKIPAPMPEIWDALQSAPGGVDKLRLFDWSLDFTKPFTIWAILTGLVLLNIGNAGLDQDTTQRFLACENAQSGKRALYASMWAAIPVVALFMAIGSLLHIFYNRPDLMGVSVGATNAFAGEKITVFMSFILSEIPPGLRGLVTVGVIAAAAINSGLISMSAVVVCFMAWCVAGVVGGGHSPAMPVAMAPRAACEALSRRRTLSGRSIQVSQRWSASMAWYASQAFSWASSRSVRRSMTWSARSVVLSMGGAVVPHQCVPHRHHVARPIG